MSTLNSSHLLLAAGTAADWSSATGLEESVLIRWIGPHTCLHADKENFVDAATNIAAIHNTATFVASAVFLEKSPVQAAALARESLVSIQPALRMITTDGGTQEGPGYWTYQSRALATLYSTLPNAYATPPMAMPSPAKMSNYVLNSTGPDNLPVPFADADPNPLSPLMPAWDAYARKAPAVAAWVARELKAKPDAHLMWWWTPSTSVPAKVSSLYPQTGLAALHLPGGTATLKGGDNAANHAHLDLGSVSFYRRGVQWSVDPGGEKGSPPGYYSEPTRWNYWKTKTASHSTLMIGANNQPRSAKAATTLVNATTASVNLVGALPGTTSASRTVVHGSTSMAIKDVVRSDSALPLTWQWVTDAAVSINPDTKRVVLRKNGQTAYIRFEGVPAGAVLTAAPAPETSSTGAVLTVVKLSMPNVTSLNLTSIVW
ncbi:heparinase II/III domain-containing protein [Arthrobacter crusticola]|nr:heparinase II/III family protein [Arthrobacter crusticola]